MDRTTTGRAGKLPHRLGMVGAAGRRERCAAGGGSALALLAAAGLLGGRTELAGPLAYARHDSRRGAAVHLGGGAYGCGLVGSLPERLRRRPDLLARGSGALSASGTRRRPRGSPPGPGVGRPVAWRESAGGGAVRGGA